MMDATERDDLRRLAGSATAGEWFFIEHVDDTWTVQTKRGGGGDCIALRYANSSTANAAFIAAANPQTVLRLLDEIDALRKGLGGIAETARRSWEGQFHSTWHDGLIAIEDRARALTTSSKESGE